MSYPTVANTAGGGYAYPLSSNTSRATPFARGIQPGINALNFAPSMMAQPVPSLPMTFENNTQPANASISMYAQPVPPQQQAYYASLPQQPPSNANIPSAPGSYTIMAAGDVSVGDQGVVPPTQVSTSMSTKSQQRNTADVPVVNDRDDEQEGDGSNGEVTGNRNKRSTSILVRIWTAFASFVSKHPWIFLFLLSIIVAACVMLWLQYQQTNYMANGIDQLATAAQNVAAQGTPEHQVNIVAKTAMPVATTTVTAPSESSVSTTSNPLLVRPTAPVVAGYTHPYYNPYTSDSKGIPYVPYPYPYYWVPPYGYVPMTPAYNHTPMLNQTAMVPVTSSTPISTTTNPDSSVMTPGGNQL